MAKKQSPIGPPISELAPPTHALARLPEEWSALLGEWGEPRYRGEQIFQWIHQRGVFDPAEMSNLPKSLRARLAEEELTPPVHAEHAPMARDRTRKLLVRLADEASVETILIPQLRRHDPDVDDADLAEDEQLHESGMLPGKMVTQCVSSQVGCAMGCVFCASGVAGLKRDLSAAEIVGQILHGRTHLEGEERIRNIVLMGMGEPLHNYGEVARALVLMTHPSGLGLSTRRVTLSTSGLVPQIDRLAKDFGGKVQLAISLHAVTDERRSGIMPINRKYPLAELMAALKRYPLPKRRRITIEYTLIRGVNDSPDDAAKLVKLVRQVPVKVNLIPMNPISESELDAPPDDRVESFRAAVERQGVTATVCKERGQSIDAACGQLALYGEDGEKLKRTRRLPTAR